MSRSGEGPSSARVMIVGEAFSDSDERAQSPFSGTSGQELNRMLQEAGISRSECYLTNVVNARPPSGDIEKWVVPRSKRKDITPDMVPFRDRLVKPIVREGFYQLLREIHLVQPNIILTLGSTPLWALTGAWGVTKWRGSQLRAAIGRELYPPTVLGPEDKPWAGKLIPTLHPALVLRDYGQRPIVMQDLKRVLKERGTKEYANEPDWKFIVRPSVKTALETLRDLTDRVAQSAEGMWLDFDLETRAGHIACAGISWSLEEAICIPLMCVEDKKGYFLEEEEAAIVYALYKLLTHPNVRVRGQNLLYDCQYTYRHWHFTPRVSQDTMISHHSAFAGLPKSLAFQASMYCDHYVYWKDDGKTWNPAHTGEEQLWRYNCIDCVRTREVGEVSAKTITSLGLESVDAFQQEFFWPVLQCMQRGIAVDPFLRKKLAAKLLSEMEEREGYFYRVLGHSLNPKSSKQMCELFYEDLKEPRIFSRAKKGSPPHLTCDDAALTKIALRNPILRPLIRAIGEYRSLGVFLSTFILAPLDIDGRMRTSYNICGTETFRFSSSENAFGTGTNLQNIPKGGDDDDSDFSLPNVREMYVPDPYQTIFDTDLSKADLRIVTWESDEPEMKAMLREGRDPYVEIAREFYKDPTITKTRSDGSENPKYKTFKSFAHGTHYLGTPHGLAARLGISVHQAEQTQRWYLQRNRRIAAWQKEFCEALKSRRYVQNIFGYRRYYFDRISDDTCREAIAWLPQSTVALYINRIWMNIYKNYPDIQILLQVHDSLVGQFPTRGRDGYLANLQEAGNIILPYDDPLIIPVGVKWSERSWGDCQ